MPTEAEKKEESRKAIAQSRDDIIEIKAVLLGVKGTDDGGMAQDVKELKVQGQKRNGRIGKLEIGLTSLISILTGLGILDATVFHRVIGG